jgi:predicted DCC family thiol-disulfide oxidoreductase YuxK
VLYDSTCALCVGSKRRLESWKTASLVRFVAIQSPEAKGLLPGVPEGELLGAMHVIEEGKVTSGADGWFRIMTLAPVWLAWVGWVTPRVVARPVYRLIARHRYRWFGRVCESGSCTIHAGNRPRS